MIDMNVDQVIPVNVRAIQEQRPAQDVSLYMGHTRWVE